jgi:hyperosmotically inducible periplasmic protein
MERGSKMVLALVLAVTWTLACTPEDRREAEAEVQAAESELEAAGRQMGDELAEAGESVERRIERAGRRLEPFARDAEITASVKARLAADPDVNPFTIDVDTVDGRVTLNGTVRTDYQRQEAEDLARRTEGVVEVVNLLVVGSRGG